MSPSPFSKSRLKNLLENNKDERIRSVVKRRDKSQEEISPYKKIEREEKSSNKNKSIVAEGVSEWDK